MTRLQTLWLVSLAMVAASLAIMMTLLVARMVGAKLKQRREAQRRRLVPLLLAATDDTAAAGADAGKGGRLAADLAGELVQLVQGTEREKLVANAARLGVPDWIRRRIRSGSPRVRLAAAEALGQFHDRESVAQLNKALEDRAAPVRIAAALSLAEAGEPPPAAELVYKLGIGTTENSLLAVSLFRDIAERRPEELKALLVDQAVPAGAKAAIIESLAASTDYTLVPLIVSLAGEEENPRHLSRYLAALGTFGHPAAKPALQRGLRRPEWEVRAAAAEAIGRIGLEILAPNLVQALGDVSWWVRFRSADALVRLGECGIGRLREVAQTVDEPARSAAMLTLAERKLA